MIRSSAGKRDPYGVSLTGDFYKTIVIQKGSIWKETHLVTN